MKDKLKRFWHLIERISRNIKLVDKCLIIFMILIMIQTAYTLFAHTSQENSAHPVDVVVRTSAAGIFGYFLSANFIKDTSKNNATVIEINPMVGGEGEPPYDIEPHNTKPLKPNEQQIIIATAIGIASFAIMAVARDFVEMNPASIGTISQLRDFFSGSVGFLLGTPTTGDD